MECKRCGNELKQMEDSDLFECEECALIYDKQGNDVTEDYFEGMYD
jgi:protein-arginine kinase activator protein McsA